MDQNLRVFPTDPPKQVAIGGLDQSLFLTIHEHRLRLVSNKSIVLWQLSQVLADTKWEINEPFENWKV